MASIYLNVYHNWRNHYTCPVPFCKKCPIILTVQSQERNHLKKPSQQLNQTCEGCQYLTKVCTIVLCILDPRSSSSHSSHIFWNYHPVPDGDKHIVSVSPFYKEVSTWQMSVKSKNEFRLFLARFSIPNGETVMVNYFIWHTLYTTLLTKFPST